MSRSFFKKNIKKSLTISNQYVLLCKKGGIKVDYAKDIKRMRTSAKMSHEQLAVAIGVTGQTIRNWESGKYIPSVKDYFAIKELIKNKAKEIGKRKA